ncbi:B12-binding domain-containing radical SAM protein [Rhodovulum sp. PH10]|uniref:B12-binding domain-containing radical SAM protein n=1 Tax=Rhodovulum sp. PH10 TaxID=1187851 RepID=UPI0002E3A093|nr:B12-binding domain-containing radical SAM protein [Rhodovulum sp. PH10]
MFEHAYPLTGRVRALMPPQGLLLIAASLPKSWEVRLVDENIRPATRDDFLWADAVLVTGMHAQRRQIEEICRRAHALGRTTVLGGSSVSACREFYPGFDYLHVGELGDATDALIARLAKDPSRPDRQVVLETRERRDLADFPVPAYDLCELDRYLTGSIQYSSGCPYHCEFCDIPALYGRNPRLKSPAQVLAELDTLLACGMTGPIYFVDDNFIGNRRAVRELLPALVDWQKAHGYPFIFSCEATLNIAKRPEILALMREAVFETVFCGIETPEPEALEAISKDHNMMVPIVEAVETLNAHGLEVVSGIILGLDTDRPDTGRRVLDFVEATKIPMLTINLLQALPRTPLWDRLEKEGRLLDDESRDSNVDFKMPYDQVIAMWRDCMEKAFSPAAVFARYRHQLDHTYPNRLSPPLSQRHVPWSDVKRGLRMLRNVLWTVGVKSDYRREFWRVALACLRRGQIEHLIRIGVMAHHLILSARDASAGRQKASHYSARPEEVPMAAE